MARVRHSGFFFVLVIALTSSCQSPGTIPWRAEDAAAPQESALVWVSYQIGIDSVDGEARQIRAGGPCVYYPITFRPGEHKLGLRLDYQSAIHQVRSAAAVDITVVLEAGAEYRLLDLAAGERRDRKFTPWLQKGAPPAGTVTRPAVTKSPSSPPKRM